MRSSSLTGFATVLASLFSSTDAHSWPEALNLIDSQGTIQGSTGYVRNFLPRNATGWKGDPTDSFQKTEVVAGAKVCMDRETTQEQSSGYPRLAVTPGAKVALRYAENGHVTIEEAQRPALGGPVWVFGAQDGTDNPLLTDVMQWNAQGTSGNKGGKLITTQTFDDGRCFEKNSSPKSAQRQAANPVPLGTNPLPDYGGLPCQNDFTVPMDAEIDKPYTIYWVWNFTFTEPGHGGVEIFSNCLDLDVKAAGSSSNNNAALAADSDNYNSKQPPISAAVASYFKQLGAAPSADSAVSATSAPAPSRKSSSRSPSHSSYPAMTTGGLVAEGPGGGIYASKATSSAARIATRTAQTNAIKTVYVTVNSPGSSDSDLVPTAAVHPTASSNQIDESSISSHKYTSQSTLQAITKAPIAAQSPAAQAPSANGMGIPLLSVGATGVARVSPAAGSPSAQQHNAAPTSSSNALATSAISSAASASSMKPDAPCKDKRAIKRSRIFNLPEVDLTDARRFRRILH